MNKNCLNSGAMRKVDAQFRLWGEFMQWQEWQKIANDEAHWLHQAEPGLLKAEYVRDHILRLWFADEEAVSIYELDFYPLFVADNPGGVFAPLRNKERFCLVTGDYALLWLNPDTGDYDERAIDLAPECVRYFCEKYGRRLNSVDRQLQEVTVA